MYVYVVVYLYAGLLSAVCLGLTLFIYIEPLKPS